ncbi:MULTISPECIES: cytochrome c oxidase subunit CcoM [unclassified Pseudomonas]|nr:MULTISPECIES: cytochrome c oxidase subunit CcoM [unclassified Pseudomonas]
MLLDQAVIAGVMTVMLVLSIFAGLALFIWRDSHKRDKD